MVEAERRQIELAQWHFFDTEPTTSDKFRVIQRMKEESLDVEFRRGILKIAEAIDEPEQQSYFLDRPRQQMNSRLWGEIYVALAKSRTLQSLKILIEGAGSDPMTSWVVGCRYGYESARRDAIFAIVILTERSPNLSAHASDEMRRIPILDGVSCAEAKCQALDRMTHDNSLLEPY